MILREYVPLKQGLRLECSVQCVVTYLREYVPLRLFYFSFLFVGLGYTCLHSQLLIDGHVHHWIMATRGSAYLLRTCSWVCWRLWRFEGETSGHGEWLEVSLFWGYLIYIYNVCLVYRRQVYEEFTEKDGLWHRVKFGFIAEKTIKEGVEVVQCSSYNIV